jgi:hypothetical protein
VVAALTMCAGCALALLRASLSACANSKGIWDANGATSGGTGGSGNGSGSATPTAAPPVVVAGCLACGGEARLGEDKRGCCAELAGGTCCAGCEASCCPRLSTTCPGGAVGALIGVAGCEWPAAALAPVPLATRSAPEAGAAWDATSPTCCCCCCSVWLSGCSAAGCMRLAYTTSMHRPPSCMVPAGPEVVPTALTALAGSLSQSLSKALIGGYVLRRAVFPRGKFEITGPACPVRLLRTTPRGIGCDHRAWCVTTLSMTTLTMGTARDRVSPGCLSLSFL